MYKDPNEKTLPIILEKDDKCVNEAGNALSEISRKLYAKNFITINKINKLVDTWTLLRYQPNDKLRSSAKSNALKALADRRMTWNTFCKLGEILNVERINITFQYVWRSGEVQFYQTSLNNDKLREDEDINSMLKDVFSANEEERRFQEEYVKMCERMKFMEQLIVNSGLEDQLRQYDNKALISTGV